MGKSTTEYFISVLAGAAIVLALSSCSARREEAGMAALRLRYNRPAAQWTEALPIGNGRLGGMIFGEVPKEHIQFNEDTLWTGLPRDYSHPGANKHLSEIRRLLFEGRQDEAESLALRSFMSVPLRQERYQPFGDLWIEEVGEAADPGSYERDLDLDTATASVRYARKGAHYTRSVFASYPDQVLVVRLTAAAPGRLDVTVTLTSPHKEMEIVAWPDSLALRGRVGGYKEAGTEAYRPSGLAFEARLKVHECDGRVEQKGTQLRISEAHQVTLLLAAATSFRAFNDIGADPAEHCERTLSSATKTYRDLRERHVTDHQALFRRVAIDLGASTRDERPTDERVRDYQTAEDPALAALLFQYGRYLLIASSRPGSQPANLQGLWNDRLEPPWESKFTTNINFQMNYWPAESANLSECHEPMFDLIRDCSSTGSRVAETHYGARGWVVHHNTDLWRGAAPINASDHGIWPTGGAWMCQHLWWRYEFTQNTEFLRTRAYPLMKEAARFFEDYLVEDPRSTRRWLVSGPSCSPENGGLVMGPTMDHQIIRDLFARCVEASRILGVDTADRARWEDLGSRIAPNLIGRLGQLQEWTEDRDDPNNKHRHISHLWALHPGADITREDTPGLFKAAQTSLEMRGDEGTGWSLAWKINLWARLRDGDRAHRLLRRLLRPAESTRTELTGGGVYPNLFGAHPPFQIDGNFGAVSGIAEMILQSHRRTPEGDPIVEILPALPSAWPEGRVRGLRARGGFVTDISWQDGELLQANLTSLAGSPCVVQYQNRSLKLETESGRTYRLSRGKRTIRLSLR